MPELTKQQAIHQINKAVADARWAGLTDEEIRALFLAAVLTRT